MKIDFVECLNIVGSICSIVALLLVVQVHVDMYKIVEITIGVIGGLLVGASVFKVMRLLKECVVLKYSFNYIPIWGIYWLLCLLTLSFLIMGSIVLFCSLTEFVLDNLSALFKFFLDL